MLQKGVAAGEITPADAAKAEAARLEPDADGETDPAALARLPLTVRALIDRTRRLHGHVAALHRSLEAAPP